MISIKEECIRNLNLEIITNKNLVKLIGVVSFILFTAFGAYVWIPLPFTPVPITLQTFFVLLSGAVLGKKLGTLSQLGYWIMGALGLPFFARGSSGAGQIFGPTGGYLLGFILASWLIGWLTSHRKTGCHYARIGEINLIIAFILGNLTIYFFGVSWLMVFLHIPLTKALFLGIFPFIPGDILKIIFATLLYKKIQPRIDKIFLSE